MVMNDQRLQRDGWHDAVREDKDAIDARNGSSEALAQSGTPRAGSRPARTKAMAG
jgi:hypothetical protein